MIRIAFALMIVILIILVLLTTVYYALDLVVQGGCRTIHDDQPFLIDFALGKFIYIYSSTKLLNLFF